MKRISTLFLLTIFTGTVLFAGNGPGFSPAAADPIDDVIRNVPESPLDSSEAAGLLFMKEEEKLARDVYRELSDRWNLRAFSNIARSDTHRSRIVESTVTAQEEASRR